ncbi:MAG: hypothetical protein OEY73_04385 [Hadesarchaea archaeon]|nr:hypothetical protein [Hadesarchaea archaeon]
MGVSYGNVVGSNIVDITPILALAAISGVASINKKQLVRFMWEKRRLTRSHGLVLLAFYAFYLAGLVFFYTSY